VEAVLLRAFGARTVLSLVLDEGKNRHVRRMFGALKDPRHGTPLKVLELKRIRFGPLTLDLPSGNWRF
jgi:23S rRNA pseudouridine2605 synthase